MAVLLPVTIVLALISFLSQIDATPLESSLSDGIVEVSSESSTLPNHFSNLLTHNSNHRAEIEELTTTTLVITSDIVTSTTTIDMSTPSSFLGSGTTPYPGIILSAPTISLDSTTSHSSTDTAVTGLGFTLHPAPRISTTNSLPPIANISSSNTVSITSTTLPKYTGTAANITIVTSSPAVVSSTTIASSTATDVSIDTTSTSGDVSGISTDSLSTTTVVSTTSEVPTSTSTSTRNGAEDFKSKENLGRKMAVCLALGIIINTVFALVL